MRSETAERVTTAGQNRLAQETSPYLLQHAGNPVDWYPWGEEALSRAKAEDKPIFLSIGYSACHWCHVMEKESFEDPEIAQILNEHFVSIKVDREERPDVDAIYMDAVQAMTGRGGWPLSVFLTPDLRPFYGGTYFPREDSYGLPGFESLLNGIIKTWTERRADIESVADQLTEVLRQLSESSTNRTRISSVSMESAYKMLQRTYDKKWGGFGGAPKFPQAGAISLLLRRYYRTSDQQTLDMAVNTLDHMANGGMYDQIGGGFHRYSVDEHWLVPHFEKMLYDNALLAQAYLEAYQLTGRSAYARVARETLDYVLREMQAPGGGFYSAQDADSEGEEGKFYVWTRDEIREALPKVYADLFMRYYGVSDEGTFEGKNILHVVGDPAVLAREFGLSIEEFGPKLRELRERLRSKRAERVEPRKDTKILTAWNGMMISSLASAARVLGEPRYGDEAVRAASFIWEEMRDGDGLFRVHTDEESRVSGFLDDYAEYADSLIDLYEMTFDRIWLDRANRVADQMVNRFWDEEDGGFFFSEGEAEDLIVRRKSYYDGSVPAGNSVAAYVLLRLAKHLDRVDLREKAEHVLSAVGASLVENPMAHTHMLRALDFYLYAPVEIAIVGSRDASDTEGLLSELNRRYLANRVAALRDPVDAFSVEGLPLLKGKTMIDNQATVYICENYACQAPITDAGAFGRALDDLSEK